MSATVTMIELFMLGALDLKAADGRALHSILAQPKRLALLAYLAAHPDHGARRDSVVALFWPELDSDHARGALRQSLRFLRRELGEGILNGHSDEAIGFEPATIWCDVVAFQQACEARQPAEALRLYRGGFLEGFFVSGASPELERWIESERTRLRRLAARAAAELAQRAERDGDLAAAAQAAQQAVDLDPDDEAAVARLIGLLDRSGNRAGALSAFETFRRLLQQQYDSAPSPETDARMQSIRDRKITFPGAGAVDVAVPIPAATRVRPERRSWWNVGAVTSLVAVAAIAAALTRGHPLQPSDPQLVAVFPFRVSGADSSLRHLSEGMVELMALELTGEGGPRAVPPGALLSLWHRIVPPATEGVSPQMAEGIAHRLGAGRFLDGAVVGSKGRLTITATVLQAEDGRTGAHASVSGPYDSLQVLVDQLTAQLLVGEAGARESRLAMLTSLPVLRAYLKGRTAFQRGRWDEALRHFSNAVLEDSTFAPAALGLRSSSRWLNSLDALRGERLAWKFRDRLSAFDRAFLIAELGPRYPAPYPAPERIGAWQQVLAQYPEAAEAWYRLGDRYFHDGPTVGMDAPLEHARAAFHRAIALDSVTGSEGLSHLLEIAAWEGDTAALRPLLAMGRAADSSAERAESYRWIAAFTARDSAALSSFRPHFRELRSATLGTIWALSQQAGYDVADAVRAEEALAARVEPGLDPADVLTSVYELALNRGRPQDAQYLADLISPGWSDDDRRAVVVLSALYGDGDTTAAATAVRALARHVEARFADGAKLRHSQYEYVCVVQQWRLAHGDFAGTPAALAKLRIPDPTAPAWLITQNAACGAALEASLAASRARPEAELLLQRADSLAQAIPGWKWSFPRHRVMAHLWEARRDWRRALMAIRRRPRGAVRYLAADLRKEAWLAECAGDTAGAVRAYRHYLALRLDPEPVLRSQRDSTRVELARLVAVAQ